MKKRNNPVARASSMNPSRRRFVQGLAAGGALAGLGFLDKPVWALGAPAQLRELSGTDFDLVLDETPVNFTGKMGVATTINGQVPGPVLRWREGDTITLRVTNRRKSSSSIHWHGIILPSQMDGVPGLSFAGIAPGETFTYRFKVGQSGTYWYHSHSGFQEQTGQYGSIVIEPRERDPFAYDRDYVVLLSDWTDASPQFVFSRLKEMDGYYNYAKLTAVDFLKDARKDGLISAFRSRQMWNEMRMSPRDLTDVSGATYTYLMNGATPSGNWRGLFRRGEKVRLRIVNGSAMSYFDVRIPGLKMTVVAADGQNVHPVSVDEFRIGVAETYDVIVEPHDDRAYTIFAQSIDRSGYARGTLAPSADMEAIVPPMDPVPTLTMADMGMSMKGMDMSGMDMKGMNHGGMDMKGMNHGGMGMKGVRANHDMMEVKYHSPSEYGPGTVMHVDQVSTRLDDPGVGLRNNGRRVLTYADLKTLGTWLDPREPGRDIEIHLTGNMERYMWSFNGVKFSDAEPIRFTYGERLRIVLVNDTMMDHPIHLHGLWSEVEAPDGSFQVRKHTVSVKPGHAVSYRVLADAKGRWAYHCHLLYHMDAGMFREVRVA